MGIRISFPMIFLALLGLITPSLTDAPDDSGKIIVNACLACHTARKPSLDKTFLTREKWNEAVERMVSYGAEIPKGKLPELLDYLSRTHEPTGSAGESEK